MSNDEMLDQYYADQPRPLEHHTEAFPAPQSTLEPVPDDGKRRACRHIMTDGRRCGSPALRCEDFCYYHHTTRRPAPRKGSILRKRSQLDLPRPEDRAAVQHSIGEVLRMIADDQIDPRRAGLLLYGLQIASHNLPRQDPRATPEETVEEVTLDPIEGLLALPAEYQNARREKTLEEILHEQWERDKALLAQDEADAEVRRQTSRNEDFAAKPGEGVSCQYV